MPVLYRKLPNFILARYLPFRSVYHCYCILMKKILFLTLIAAFWLIPIALKAKPFNVSGRMEYAAELEGGCWYLLNDDGQKYQLIGTQEQLQQLQVIGRVVRLRVEEANVASICMIGKNVRVLEILDAVGYPTDMPWAELKISGRVYKSKAGCWYVKTKNRKYELSPQNMPKKYKRSGVKFVRTVRVMQGKAASTCGFDGLILFAPEKAPIAKEKRAADPR